MRTSSGMQRGGDGAARASTVHRPRTSGEGDEVGYVPPVNDMHGRPMVPATLAKPDDPRVVRVIRAGEEFFTADEHMAVFASMHLSFRRHWSF